MNPDFMRRAVELAERGRGVVNPNPCVGAVIVKNNRVIGEGWHHRYGDLHAERDALAHLSESANGADMYVTLEPCCHQGKQPPCTQAILENGIRSVYIGSDDPNPLVSGKGAAYLQDHNITVTRHVLKEECDALNPVFFHYIKTKTPYIALKYAMTMDGKTAAYTGESRWITGESARLHTHRLRHELSGIMVGILTVLKDDPMLNCRIENCTNPIRIVCDSQLRIPLDSQLVQTAQSIPLIVAYTEAANSTIEKLTSLGVTLIKTPAIDGHVDLPWLTKQLGAQGMDSILVEGGGTLNEAILKHHLANHIYAYIAPKIFGGTNGFSPVGGTGVAHPDEAWNFHLTNTTRLGDDILLEFDPQASERT